MPFGLGHSREALWRTSPALAPTQDNRGRDEASTYWSCGMHLFLVEIHKPSGDRHLRLLGADDSLAEFRTPPARHPE